MSIPYLKITPEEAVQKIDHLIIEGYQVKDNINSDYFENASDVSDGSIEKWSSQALTWANTCIEELEMIYISQKEAYYFRDATSLPYMRVGTNAKWNGIVNQIEARLEKLKEYDDYIRKNFNIHLEFVSGDKIVQHGSDSEITINK